MHKATVPVGTPSHSLTLPPGFQFGKANCLILWTSQKAHKGTEASCQESSECTFLEAHLPITVFQTFQSLSVVPGEGLKGH